MFTNLIFILGVLETCALNPVSAALENICGADQWQCSDESCISVDNKCDGIVDCADASDETQAACSKTQSPKPGKCILPPLPRNGDYVITDIPDALPGAGYETVRLRIYCNYGFGVSGNDTISCHDGVWTDNKFPECIHMCYLDKHPSIDYSCLNFGGDFNEVTRDCNQREPEGTIIRPQCKSPKYQYSGVMDFMECVEGRWNYYAICTPDGNYSSTDSTTTADDILHQAFTTKTYTPVKSANCGTLPLDGVPLSLDYEETRPEEKIPRQLPWHAGIYFKTTTPYRQICGATLVTASAVISAAHCFWDSSNETLNDVSMYAVAVGKRYRPWGTPEDRWAQKSDVRGIKIPARFRGAMTNFQDDIAILMMSTPFRLNEYVKPICLDFDFRLEKQQLKNGSLGMVGGWGIVGENGFPSKVLKVVKQPYVPIEKCIAEAPNYFIEYITSDKICAGGINGTALCRGDSGGGLAFPARDRGGVTRFYLRGVLSTAPNNEHLCNQYTWGAYTQVTKQQHFIQEHLYV